MKFIFKCCFLLLVCSVPMTASAQNIRVEVENLQAADGFYFTPLFAGFHDGGFDYFDSNVGATASASLESMAEEGDLAGLLGDISAAGGQGFVVTDPSGFGSVGMQPPVFDPGNTAAEIFNVSTTNRFFSFGAMVIPSNDAFFGNNSATAHEVFDAAGNFTGPVDITIFGANLYDAGTEANDGLGAPFSANGGTSTSESLTVRTHPGLTNFLGTSTAAGTTIGSDILAGTAIARIRITAVPEPGSVLFLAAIAGVGIARRRR